MVKDFGALEISHASAVQGDDKLFHGTLPHDRRVLDQKAPGRAIAEISHLVSSI